MQRSFPWKTVFFLLGAVMFSFLFFRDDEKRIFDTGVPKNVSVSVDGAALRYSGMKAVTVGELLEEIGMEVVPGDGCFLKRMRIFFPV
jgi:hypothetical protein